MKMYHNIDPSQKETPRVLRNLITLRKQLDAEIPNRNLSKTLILGTWNIREFDSASFGERTEEAMTYIAEIVSRFDLIAIQEVRKDLRALDQLVDFLGRDRWHYIFTDITEGSPGNKERMAYLYDTRKVTFGGLAAELVLPPIRMKDAEGKSFYKNVKQVARTPFVVGFTSGDTSFILASVHILYGTSKGDDQERVEEIRHFAQFLNERTQDPTTWSRNIIALGDFNIFKKDDETMKALLDEGFVVPAEFLTAGSNISQDKIFDQIAFHTRPDRFETSGRAGVFNFFKSIYRPEDQDDYVEQMGDSYLKNSRGKTRTSTDQSRYYKTYWRTHQMSDHLPLWVELKIDFTEKYLQEKLTESQAHHSKSRSLTAPPIIPVDAREHVAQFTQNGVTTYEDFQGSIYDGGNYAQFKLGGMDLSHKSFEKASFISADLNEANLQASNCTATDFTDATLHMANLTGADFADTTFLRTNLYNCNCFETDFSNAHFEEADLRLCIFDDADVSNATFLNCQLSDAQQKVVISGGGKVS